MSSPAAGSGAAAPGARVQLVTRPGCHLCDDAREVVRRVASELDVTWAELDLDRDVADPVARARWSEEVPVVLVDAAQHCFWTVDEERLRRSLTRSGGPLRRLLDGRRGDRRGAGRRSGPHGTP